MRGVAGLVGLALALGACAEAARAWGAEGHRIVNGDAIRALPTSVPAFVRSPAAADEIARLGPEADRLKGAGRSADADNDPGHYLDLSDDGTVLGIVPLAQLPPTREAYDTALRAGPLTDPLLGGKPADQYRAGYLPYSIIDGWQQLVMDFGIWRIDVYGETHGATAGSRAAFAADRQLRETLTLRDIGYWGHFVGDASQPLHVSEHFNGWGPFPNPANYTQSHTIHADFETTFVDAHATPALVQPLVAPYAPASAPFPARVPAYLLASQSYVPTVYRLTGSGAFAQATPEAVAFTLARLAAGAQMLRDGIVEAYAAAADQRVGYPGAIVRDVENGTVPPEKAITL